ncbi:histone-lysine N-methyltransferase SETDB1-B-like isoform X1 [Anarrhichthys ocellatus]|uniref:histone-lysine N-methyltransferase SETDB1-B-like isoform X1 n=2 Tax=Anarrhichthys ocellatus TaxID=433405 RepID=UPI0012EE9C10|nr:histone-lysine N-methyltransferase SETDB1-B-like isoform X1 [Anarrhichthys ocellatus]
MEEADVAIMEVDEMELQESDKRVENQTKRDEERDDEENMSDFPCKSVASTNESLSKETELKDGPDLLNVKRAVVVLTRLPDYKISALRPPTPPQFYSEDDSLSSSDSDMQWEPEDDSSDAEFSLSHNKKRTGRHATAHTSRMNNNNVNAPEQAPVIISSVFAHCSNETTKVRPNLPEVEVIVDTVVLARKRTMRWQRGKILDMVTREDGRLKYKVGFDEKGKSLVSGHHIAFDVTPKLEQLYVGARVVVKCQDNTFFYRPGILAELPSRKNRLRFLVFLDCHVAVYVGLPLFHLVCRPLENVVDDIPECPHKSFMTQYLKDWPYPHLTQYRPGQSLNVEFSGVQQRCEVQLVDSSLMQVLFQDTQHKEWIHRGSMRLEHMARFLEMKAEEHRNDSD